MLDFYKRLEITKEDSASIADLLSKHMDSPTFAISRKERLKKTTRTALAAVKKALPYFKVDKYALSYWRVNGSWKGNRVGHVRSALGVEEKVHGGYHGDEYRAEQVHVRRDIVSDLTVMLVEDETVRKKALKRCLDDNLFMLKTTLTEMGVGDILWSTNKEMEELTIHAIVDMPPHRLREYATQSWYNNPDKDKLEILMDNPRQEVTTIEDILPPLLHNWFREWMSKSWQEIEEEE